MLGSLGTPGKRSELVDLISAMGALCHVGVMLCRPRIVLCHAMSYKTGVQ